MLTWRPVFGPFPAWRAWPKIVWSTWSGSTSARRIASFGGELAQLDGGGLGERAQELADRRARALEDDRVFHADQSSGGVSRAGATRGPVGRRRAREDPGDRRRRRRPARRATGRCRRDARAVRREPRPHGGELVGALARAGERRGAGVVVAVPAGSARRRGAGALPPSRSAQHETLGARRARRPDARARAPRRARAAGRATSAASSNRSCRRARASAPRALRGARRGGGREETSLPDELSVALGVDAAVARRGAAAHVGERAGAKRGRARIAFVQRRIGTTSSSASFARRARALVPNGPR